MAQKKFPGITPTTLTSKATPTGKSAAPVSGLSSSAPALPENLVELLQVLADEGAVDLITVQGCMSVISDEPNVAECDNRVWVLAGFNPARFGMTVTDGSICTHEVKRYAPGGGL